MTLVTLASSTLTTATERWWTLEDKSESGAECTRARIWQVRSSSAQLGHSGSVVACTPGPFKRSPALNGPGRSGRSGREFRFAARVPGYSVPKSHGSIRPPKTAQARAQHSFCLLPPTTTFASVVVVVVVASARSSLKHPPSPLPRRPGHPINIRRLRLRRLWPVSTSLLGLACRRNITSSTLHPSTTPKSLSVPLSSDLRGRLSTLYFFPWLFVAHLWILILLDDGYNRRGVRH